jgi:hypothetical protein
MTSYTQHYLLGQQFQDPRLLATFELDSQSGTFLARGGQN